MKIRNVLTTVLIATGLLVSIPFAASAEEDMHENVNVVETITATTYFNGGVGKDEEAAMHRVAKVFPLRIIFSERKNGEFVTDVPVVISDARGNPVLELPRAGPMLFVMLPNGKYKVSSRFEGLTESQEVTLTGKESKELNFHWKGLPR